MAKRLTEESLNTEPKFAIELDVETHKNLIRYIILTNNGLGRNEFINSLIKKELEGKVLDNTFIHLFKTKTPYYFNKSELIENGIAEASKFLIDNDLEETVVIESIPNNLDEFSDIHKSYCYENNKDLHAGVYILPNLDGGDDNYLFFKYDSKNETVTVMLVNDIDIYFYGRNQAVKEKLLATAEEIKTKYANKDLCPNDIMKNYSMYNYKMYASKFKKTQMEEKGHINYLVEGCFFKNFK